MMPDLQSQEGNRGFYLSKSVHNIVVMLNLFEVQSTNLTGLGVGGGASYN